MPRTGQRTAATITPASREVIAVITWHKLRAVAVLILPARKLRAVLAGCLMVCNQ
jgi:hypothetical protein